MPPPPLSLLTHNNSSEAYIGRILLASLVPILVGLFFGIFVAPPVLSYDVMHGLHIWIHYIKGGAWHSLSVPDPSNIAQNIETPVSWWTPGLYLPIGIVSTLGLSYQSAAIVVFSVTTLSLGVGAALLAKELGSPVKALPWIALAATCSQSVFGAFSVFSGGDCALYAIFPWLALIAWRLRKSKYLTIGTIPVLFLTGTFIKHSFTIYAITIFALLFSEYLTKETFPPRIWKIIRNNIPLIIAGILYVLGCFFLFDRGVTPASSSSNLQRPFALLWGFNAFAPLIGASSLQHFVTIAFPTPTGLWEDFDLGGKGWLLTLFSPLPFLLYIWLSVKGKTPLARFAGITSLIACGFLFLLMWRGAAISLEARHYQPAALLLLIVFITQAFTRSAKFSLSIRLATILFMSWASIGLIEFHLTQHRSGSEFHKKYQYLHSDASAAVIDQIKLISTQDSGSLIFLSEMGLGLELYQSMHKTNRLAFNPFGVSKLAYYGRVPRLCFAMPDNRVERGDAITFRDSFKDYSSDEWQVYSIDGWQIWIAEEAEPEVESNT